MELTDLELFEDFIIIEYGGGIYDLHSYHPLFNPTPIPVAVCYEEGTYYYYPDSFYLEIDDARDLIISQRINPISEYWKLPF